MHQTTQSRHGSAASKTGKPFCKVCFDAGKPEKDYMSHYVKSAPGPNGKVVCPTLLIQACLNCGQNGHTSGYCVEPKINHRYNQSNQQRTQSTIVLSNPRPNIGAEAELKLMTTMFKSKSQYKNDDFPSLKPEPKKQEPQPNQAAKEEPKEEPTHGHVYNPKSNPFGALSQKQPKQPKQKSFQPPKQPQESQAKPMTMAERLKNPIKPDPKPAATTIKPDPKPAATTIKPATTTTVKPNIPDMPPKSQFWWQDEDD